MVDYIIDEAKNHSIETLSKIKKRNLLIYLNISENKINHLSNILDGHYGSIIEPSLNEDLNILKIFNKNIKSILKL